MRQPSADRLFLAAFRKPLSVSMIIILIIQTPSAIDLLIQLIYCLNKLYSSYPFKRFGAIRKLSNNHAVTIMQTNCWTAHTCSAYTLMCEHLFDSAGYPSNHMRKKEMATKACHVQSTLKGIITERLW